MRVHNGEPSRIVAASNNYFGRLTYEVLRMVLSAKDLYAWLYDSITTRARLRWRLCRID